MMRRVPVQSIYAVIALLVIASRCLAQDPFGGGQAADPFGGADNGQAADPFGGAGGGQAADPFGGGGQVADPFGAGAPASRATPKPKPAGDQIVIDREESDPVVLAIRDMNPSTPDDLMFAVQTLFDVGRTDEAKQYLQKLLAAKPSRDQLEAMYDEYGGSFFFRLSRDPRMEPEGAQLGQAVRDAAYEAAREPERLRSLVGQLRDPAPSVRRQARADLLRAGDAAIGPLLKALGDGQRTAEHPQIRFAFQEFGKAAVEPLLGALESPNEVLRRQVIMTLGEMETPQAIPALVNPALDTEQPDAVRRAAREALVRIVGAVPSPYEAARYLQRKTLAYLEGGALAAAPDYEGMTTIWRWDDEQQTVVPGRYAPAEASRMLAARLARQLIQLAPDNADYRRLYLVTNLTDAKLRAGIDEPLPEGPGTIYAEAIQAGPAVIEDVLAYAMHHEYLPAAIAAAEVMAGFADEQLLRSVDGRPRPLVLALRSGDRRLRLAAADAVMQIDPQRPYPGSSYLPETLGHLIRTTGTRRALVSHPRVEKAQTLAGMLVRMGFEADAATSGRETFRLASKNPDHEFVLISDAVDFPAADETIQALRKDPRTSSLPVGLMARKETLSRARKVAGADPLVEAFPRPHNDEMMAFQVSRLLRLAGHQAATYEQRLRHAERALEHLLQLAENSRQRPFYDLYRQREAITSALSTPQLAVPAARVLGLLGSPDAQRSLVTLASQHARPLAERHAACEAFDLAVAQHGLLLTRDEILLQYERYNQSASLDSGTQQVLGAILDTIERPRQQSSAALVPSAANAAAGDG